MVLDSEEEGNETAGDAGIGFFDPIVRLVFDPRISCGTGPSYGTAGCGAYSCPSRNASTPRDGFLERPDRGPHFVLSRWRPAAPWRELGGGADQALDRHPCVAHRGRKPREKMKIGQTLRSGSFEFDLHEKKPWLVPQTD